MIGKPIAVALTAMASLAFATAPSFAASGRFTDFTLRLTSASPDSATGIKVHLSFHAANDPNGKPLPLRSATIRGPRGLRFDSAAVSECTASDDQVRALGSNACPADTQLALGTFRGSTGFGPPVDPFVGDDHVFNAPNQLLEIITAPGSSASPVSDRLYISGSTLTAHPPFVPGAPPNGQAAVKSIDFTVPVRGSARKAFISTPPHCPRNGWWTTTGTFNFTNGASDIVRSRTPCRQRARMRLSVQPRRVPVGRSVRIHFQLRSHDKRCLAGASVRLGRRTARIGVGGQATLTTSFSEPGRERALATSPRCRSASAVVRVVRAAEG